MSRSDPRRRTAPIAEPHTIAAIEQALATVMEPDLHRDFIQPSSPVSSARAVIEGPLIGLTASLACISSLAPRSVADDAARPVLLSGLSLDGGAR